MLNKIEYRLKYRSTKEMDLIFRKFWSSFKYHHSKNDLITFVDLINEDDVDIYEWIIGASDAPKNYICIIKKIRSKLEFKVK